MPVRPGVEIPDSLDSFIRECSKTYQSGYLYQANQDYINGIRTLPVDAHIPFLMGPYYDTPFTYSDDDLYQKLLGNNPTGNITDHYSEVSNGIAALTGEVIPACENCTVSTQNHYFSQELNTGSIDYAGDVLDIHDDTINFAAVDEFGNSLYDKDDDGIIDFVVFIHSGGAGEEGADNFFSHRYQFSEYNGQMYVTDDLIPGGGPNDYYRVNDYAIAAEMNGDGSAGDDLTDIGPYCH